MNALISPLFVVVIWVTDWISGVVLLLTLPIVLLFMVLAGLSAQRRTNEQWRALGRMSNHFLDVVDGLTTLRIFGRARAQRRAVELVTNEYRRTTMGVLRLSFLSSFVLELFASLSVAIVAVQVGLRLIGGNIEPSFGALPDRKLERVRVADPAIAAEAIRWLPRTSLDDGLARTVEFYRAQLVDR